MEDKSNMADSLFKLKPNKGILLAVDTGIVKTLLPVKNFKLNIYFDIKTAVLSQMFNTIHL